MLWRGKRKEWRILAKPQVPPSSLVSNMMIPMFTHQSTPRSLSSHAIEMSRQTLLVEIERAAPWRTKVSSMLAALKSPEEIRGLRVSGAMRTKISLVVRVLRTRLDAELGAPEVLPGAERAD
jgi:hypothetical protein